MGAKTFFLLIYQHLCFWFPFGYEGGTWCCISMYNTLAILCCLGHPFQVFMPTKFSLGGQPFADSSLAPHQRLYRLAAQQTESCSVRPRNLTQRNLLFFRRSLTALQFMSVSPPCQVHKFISIWKKGVGERKGISPGSGPTSRLWDKTKASDSWNLPADIALLRIDKLETHLRQVSFLPESLQWQFRW